MSKDVFLQLNKQAVKQIVRKNVRNRYKSRLDSQNTKIKEKNLLFQKSKILEKMIIEPEIKVIPFEKMNATVTRIDEFLTDEAFPKNAWQGLKEIWQGINEEVPPWFLGLIFCVFYLSVIDCMHNNGNSVPNNFLFCSTKIKHNQKF
jgi:hypothetical protein